MVVILDKQMLIFLHMLGLHFDASSDRLVIFASIFYLFYPRNLHLPFRFNIYV